MAKKNEDKKNWAINWSSVITTVVTGAVLGALGVLGTMVYQGAILKTNTNQATSETIIETVSKNTVVINQIVKMVESNHKILMQAKGQKASPICPSITNGISTTTTVPVEEEVIEDVPEKKSPTVLKRIVDTVSLKPLWEKSAQPTTTISGNTNMSQEQVTALEAIHLDDADIVFLEYSQALVSNTVAHALDPSVTNSAAVQQEQQRIIDKMNKDISDRTKIM